MCVCVCVKEREFGGGGGGGGGERECMVNAVVSNFRVSVCVSERASEKRKKKVACNERVNMKRGSKKRRKCICAQFHALVSILS